jgi:putative FmdB family regulatory protein
MPLYEYQCDACGHRFEVIQKYSDAPIDTCVKCGGSVKKLLSSPAIQFKGSGWYITDYARAGKSDKSDRSDKSDKSESGSAASGKSESAGSGDSKSESKGDSKGKSESSSSETKSESKPSAPSTS